MTLKLLFTFLAALSILLAMLQEAHATQPRDDLFINMLNSANHPVEICNAELTFCKVIEPGKVFDDAQATGSQAIDYFQFWLTHSVIKACGKIVPLKRMIGTTVEEKEWWGKITYKLTISEAGFIRECAAISN